MTDNANFGKPPLVDRTKGRRLPTPRSDRPHREDLCFPVRCANPSCNHVRWLTRSDADKAEAEQRVCKKCQTSEAGKKGYAATATLYGADFALKAVRQQQLEHPSRYERIVESWLAELALAHDLHVLTQVAFTATDLGNVAHHFLIDFVVETSSDALAVEVNGYHHKKLRAERDYWLTQLYPGDVYFIDTDDIDHTPQAIKDTLRQLVQR
ncbi:MAG: hypothetical protein ABI947_19255 [Chloroflexota bacterium]